MKYSKQQKERRERLKKENKCVVCGEDLPENCNFFRCFGCRVRQSQADMKYKEKKKGNGNMNDNICVMCGATLPTECGKQYCSECEEKVEETKIKELVKIANEVANDKKALFDELFFEIPRYEVSGDSMMIVLYPYARIGTVVGNPTRAIILDLNHYSKDNFKKFIETISDELYKGIKIFQRENLQTNEHLQV